MRHAPLSLACAMLLACATSLRVQITTAPGRTPSDTPVATPNTSQSQNLSNAQLVQLVPGTTIVTAYSIPQGDTESIKQVILHDTRGLQFHYSSKIPGGRDLSVDHLIPEEDAKSAKGYRTTFTGTPAWPGFTELGVSSEILSALKSQKHVDGRLGLLSGCCSTDVSYEIIDAEDVPVRVVVNDREVNLPAVHARGLFGPGPIGSVSRERGEFWFLDNLDAPITLKFVIREDDRQDELNVVKIIVPVQQKQHIAAALQEEHRAIIEGLYFDFDKASIRPESGVVLASVAEVLRENPSWKVMVEGHTDNICTDAYNMKLSVSRAAAVRQALVSQYHLSATRLTTAGYGASRPKAGNDTLEGRAFNRRVELVRTDQAK